MQNGRDQRLRGESDDLAFRVDGKMAICLYCLKFSEHNHVELFWKERLAV